MATLSPHAQDKYPGFDRWLVNGFWFLFINNQRARNAFWTWSDFHDTPENLMFFR